MEYNVYPFLKQFITIIDSLKDIGLEKNKGIVAAPYDFRLSPKSNSDYMSKTVKLIENLYHEAKG